MLLVACIDHRRDAFLLYVAPILFCKACESASLPPFDLSNRTNLSYPYPILTRICNPPLPQTVFISEITARAFIIADSNKRRTLSRSDIAKALNKSDQFDFLIDIVPREEPFGSAAAGGSGGGGGAGGGKSGGGGGGGGGAHGGHGGGGGGGGGKKGGKETVSCLVDVMVWYGVLIVCGS